MGLRQIANKFSKAQNELTHERRQCEALQSDLQRIQNVCARASAHLLRLQRAFMRGFPKVTSHSRGDQGHLRVPAADRCRNQRSPQRKSHARALLAWSDWLRGNKPLGHFLTRARREQERAKVDKELERLWCVTACAHSVQFIVHGAAALSPLCRLDTRARCRGRAIATMRARHA